VGRARFKSPLAHIVMSQDIGETSNPQFVSRGLADALGLVIDGRVENQVTDELAGGGVDDPDIAAVDQHKDGVRAWVRPMPMWCSRPL
jgi:hypothetical protein